MIASMFVSCDFNWSFMEKSSLFCYVCVGWGVRSSKHFCWWTSGWERGHTDMGRERNYILTFGKIDVTQSTPVYDNTFPSVKGIIPLTRNYAVWVECDGR